MSEPTGPSSSSAPSPDATGQGGPDVGPDATQGVVAQSTSGIDLDAMFADTGSGSGHNSLNLTEGGVGGYGGIGIGGGAHASFGVPGGPTVELGAEGEFGTQGQFEAQGRHLDADSTHIDAGADTTATGGDTSGVELDPTGTDAATGDTGGTGATGYEGGTDDGAGWSDSSLDLNQGSVSADTATHLGGGVEASFSGVPGMPEIGFGVDGHFANEGGFDIGGTDLHADTSYGEGTPDHDLGFGG